MNPPARTASAKANHFKRNLLLCGARDLLPFERDQVFLAFLLCDHIDEVPAAAEAFADLLLYEVAVSTALERRKNHRFQDSTRCRVSRGHRA